MGGLKPLLSGFMLAVTVAAQTSAPPPTMQEADSLFQARKWQEAAKAYEAVTKSDPGDGRAWTRLGVSLHSQGNYAPAVEAFRQADRLHFNRQTANFMMARAYARIGDRDNAFEALRRAISHGFGNLELFHNDPDLASLRGDARFTEAAAKLMAAVKPCASRPEYAAFDFWVGEWEQQNRDGAVVGSTTVKRILENCVLHELTVNPKGYVAQAFHYFDPSLGKWRQTYADTRAGFSHWVGESRTGEMRYQGEISSAAGANTLGRSLFTRIDENRIRQVFEVSSDGGKTWTVSWDGFYVRKGK
jgi:tetratricopeptide (TPR) repeat protein